MRRDAANIGVLLLREHLINPESTYERLTYYLCTKVPSEASAQSRDFVEPHTSATTEVIKPKGGGEAVHLGSKEDLRAYRQLSRPRIFKF
jgi:hypothetical protein